MNKPGQGKIALGIILALPSLPMMGMGFFHNRGVFLAGIVMLIAGIALLILGIRQTSYKRPELQDFPTDVVINGVHYPKSAFAHVDRCISGRETVFAIQELRQITGISAEDAKKVIDNWKQYY